VAAWVAALEKRHTAALTFAEIRRALQALSALYVERRDRMAGGAALKGEGKRAAFALYYGPLHLLLVRAVVRELDAARPAPSTVVDLGCGTGVAGAAWALAAGGRPVVEGVDASGWAVDEAGWTYARLGVQGRARKGDAAAARLPGANGAVVAAFTVNELPEGARDRLLDALLAGARRGTRVLVVEPLARRVVPWWGGWTAAFRAAGGREDEWRFPLDAPPVVERLGRAAGLDPRELRGRSLYAGGPPAGSPWPVPS
jgi:hypothetical protein